ncbi:MAG: glutaminyl-peptide cyclotransferase [Bacteroidales bacterium]|nr:glutaminyl-peptide cyclotransferase [Bacteroidales bacterium]
MKKQLYLLSLLVVILNTSCKEEQLKYYSYSVEQVYPHDVSSYTQGLFFHNGNLYESTGQYGETTMRRVNLPNGEALQKQPFDVQFFGEGSVIFNNKLYMLTWMEGVVFVMNPDSFEVIAKHPNRHQGWGLTTDGEFLIMSDGSSQLFYMEPNDFSEKKSVQVTLNGHPVPYLNELEYIDGKVWANVYGKDQIVIIEPKSGKVVGLLDCSGILPNSERTIRTDVLNGIAWNPDTKELFITGKYWPNMYKIKTKEISK